MIREFKERERPDGFVGIIISNGTVEAGTFRSDRLSFMRNGKLVDLNERGRLREKAKDISSAMLEQIVGPKESWHKPRPKRKSKGRGVPTEINYLTLTFTKQTRVKGGKVAIQSHGMVTVWLGPRRRKFSARSYDKAVQQWNRAVNELADYNGTPAPKFWRIFPLTETQFNQRRDETEKEFQIDSDTRKQAQRRAAKQAEQAEPA